MKTRLLRIFSVVALSACVLTTAASAQYLKVNGVDGEAREAKHKGWIEILSVSNLPEEGAAVVAPHKRKPVVIVKKVDIASPKLWRALRRNTTFPEMRLAQGGGEVVLRDVTIAYMKKTGTRESVSLNYGSIKWEPEAAEGNPDRPVITGRVYHGPKAGAEKRAVNVKEP